MDERRIGLQPDLVARVELVAFAEYGDDLLAAELGEDLCFRAGRLDHDDLGPRAVVRNREVFRPYAVDRGLAVGIAGRGLQRQLDAVRALERGYAVHRDLALEKIHRRRPDEAGDELVVG